MSKTTEMTKKTNGQLELVDHSDFPIGLDENGDVENGSDLFDDVELEELDNDPHHESMSSETFVAGELAAETSDYGELGTPDETSAAEIEDVANYSAEYLKRLEETEYVDSKDQILLDAWHAEFTEPAMLKTLREMHQFRVENEEVVIGADDRVKITNTTAYPWRAICALRITAGDNSQWIGTGWLVGPRTVITAGHVVYIHSRGGWVKSIEVIPGQNGTHQPFKSCRATSFRSVTGWIKNRDRSYDYGAIILPKDCRYGDRLGYFGFCAYSSGTLKNMLVNLSGYPGDKPRGTQWFHARRLKTITSRTLVYDIDTAGGQSGSPVWRLINGKRFAVGIHTNGSLSGNSATRIVKPVFDNIKKWKTQGT